jgi:nucleotide-binding universal stress UspA family protein
MKILVCTDGSEQSRKAVEEAAKIAGGCNVDEVSVIHVHQETSYLPVGGEGYHFTPQDLKRFEQLREQNREDKKKLLETDVNYFTQKNIKAKGILEEGHPAETIARVAKEKGFDLLVVGSRGLGGLKKVLLGSVSNAILQESKTSVLVVK